PRAARLTFAMARHAAVDLSQIFGTPPHMARADRLPPADLVQLRAFLDKTGMPLRPGPVADQQLAAIRTQYEPYIHALADYLLDELPPWLPLPDSQDDWQTSIWEHTTTARPSY
ncbi:MAG TPA: hypothetical protein VKE41_21395, partial [Roseiflexaceae bacterium]|nr:hypothetical protein [Roseiflexaceae bacterium]